MPIELVGAETYHSPHSSSPLRDLRVIGIFKWCSAVKGLRSIGDERSSSVRDVIMCMGNQDRYTRSHLHYSIIISY